MFEIYYLAIFPGWRWLILVVIHTRSAVMLTFDIFAQHCSHFQRERGRGWWLFEHTYCISLLILGFVASYRCVYFVFQTNPKQLNIRNIFELFVDTYMYFIWFWVWHSTHVLLWFIVLRFKCRIVFHKITWTRNAIYNVRSVLMRVFRLLIFIPFERKQIYNH